jgi:hypothetical protein
MTMTTSAEVAGHLAGLESVWETGLSDAYAFYRDRTSPPVALAAALVESATRLQRLGEGAPDPPELLIGDLCLARASRLLADTGDQALQVAFAAAVERAAAAAAGGPAARPVRDLLVAATGGDR